MPDGRNGKLNTWLIGTLVSVIVAMGGFLAGNVTASGQVEKVKNELADVRIEVNTLKTIIPEVRDDIRDIKDAVQKMNDRLEEQGKVPQMRRAE